jgi:PAS domain S-box-containing protein
MSIADLWRRVGVWSSYRLRWPVRYGVAVLAVIIATLLEAGIYWAGPFHQAFMMYYPTVVLVAMWAGFGPGILTTALSATAASYFFIEPRNSFAIRNSEDLVGPLLFAFIGVFLTVITTSRNRVKQDLRVSESELSRAQTVAQVGSWHYDLEKETLRLSDEARRIVGITAPEEFSLSQGRSMVHPDDLERVDRTWRAAFAAGAYEDQLRIVVNGKTQWVRLQANVERDLQGRPSKAAGTVQDITRTKLAAERREEFERVVQGLDDMIAVVDREYRYILANNAFLKHRRAKPEDVIGRTIFEVVTPESVELVKRKIDECLQGKVVQYEMRYSYPVMGERELFVSYFPIEGPARVERVACILQDVTERKDSERSLRLFRTLIDQSNDAVEVVDPETLRFLDVNERACRDLGYTREELLSMTVFDINPALDEARRAKIEEKLKEHGSEIHQAIHQRKDGTIFPVETSLRWVELDRNYVVAVSRDTTERRFVEKALLESEDRYRDLVEHSEDLVCTHDLEGNLVSVNPAPARILGYTVEEMLRIPMRDMIVPEGRELFDAYLERLRTTGQPEKGLLCVMTRNGEVRTWEYYNTLRTEGLGKPTVRGMAHDVTERRRAELALGISEQRYRMLFEKTVAGVGIITVDGELMDCNDAWARMFGYESASECRGKNVRPHYFDEADRVALLNELKREGSLTDRELHVRRIDGEEFWLLVNDVWLPDSENRGLIQATVVDITARKHAQEATRRSEERFRVALKESPVTVFNQDRNLRYTWIYNPHLCWTDAVIGKTDDEITGAKQAARLTELKRSVLDTGKPLREEVTIVHEGRKYALDLTIEPLFDAEKKICRDYRGVDGYRAPARAGGQPA